ncbi:MAG: PAS domain S-box protein [Chloroflexi bacterium]|nr:PAS domain S-box protein [Chloroflexota bacterium]
MLLAPPSARMRRIQWTLPVALGIVAVLFEFGLAHWVHNVFGDVAYFGVDVVFYATVVPLIAWLITRRLASWLEAKEGAEQRARATERRLASISAASADAILGLDPDGRIGSWNRGAEMLFGFSPAEICGRPLADLLGSGDAAQVESHWLTEAVQSAGFVRGHETTCQDAAQHQVAVELTATRLTDDAGNPLGMSVILRDVSERKRRTEDIQRLNDSLSAQVAARTRELAEKVEELARANVELQELDQMRSDFVSLLAHQLRAPLANMAGAVERIQTDCGAMNPTCTRMVAILNQQTQRLDRLAREVLSAAAIESGQLALHPEPVSVLPIVQQVAEQMRTRGRAFRLPTKPGLPLVFADRDRVAEVLANLCDNADKYSPPGNDVLIEARADETHVTLSVRDLGPGVPPHALERIFDKFYRTDSSDAQPVYGYGLGLYICRRLVDAQGGHIWAENHPDGGAVFSFTLPAAR